MTEREKGRLLLWPLLTATEHTKQVSNIVRAARCRGVSWWRWWLGAGGRAAAGETKEPEQHTDGNNAKPSVEP